ncbi:membrane associated rhomboid family serine protease [Hoeflea marina]|uniref:Membrane associated rhomboid family serine protease n=1 Tax=Hoeflea marina TaxID=274592 RepID=A0A317PK27_9HYPH|nr:rhomboid family intramembrane serine protease [Hoeflea marina]PWV98077.1 membrane associated rhomboid family serine protease [Hoeflea marina]
MFIPLHDFNSLKHIRLQWVTWSLIAVNLAIWGLTGLAGEESEFTTAAVLGLGYIPAVSNGLAYLDPLDVLVPDNFTYLTYAFVHGNFFHVASNMLFLWVFGDNVEDALGHVRFLIFYLACAAAGAFVHGLLLPHSQAPLIGASGAVAGIVAAYLILHPRIRIWVLILGRIPLPLPAYIPLLLWVGFQFVMLLADPEGEVSWATHAGGILAGGLLVVVMRRRGVPLFDRVIESPRAVVHKSADPAVAAKSGPDAPPPVHWGR